MVGLAPREMDLAWMIFLHQFFEDLTAKLELPGMPELHAGGRHGRQLRGGQRPHPP